MKKIKITADTIPPVSQRKLYTGWWNNWSGIPFNKNDDVSYLLYASWRSSFIFYMALASLYVFSWLYNKTIFFFPLPIIASLKDATEQRGASFSVEAFMFMLNSIFYLFVVFRPYYQRRIDRLLSGNHSREYLIGTSASLTAYLDGKLSFDKMYQAISIVKARNILTPVVLPQVCVFIIRYFSEPFLPHFSFYHRAEILVLTVLFSAFWYSNTLPEIIRYSLLKKIALQIKQVKGRNP